MIIGICVFLLLWKLRKKETPRGLKLGLYLILASLGRFAVEFYRLNPKVLLGFTVPQIIACLSIMLGVFVLLSEKLRYKVEIAR
jgi:prolipoprotein diacylglyceryltransferase